MIEIASVVLLLALPFLLWPLLRPPQLAEGEVPSPAADAAELVHQAEEVELDLASGRLDQPEAERRLAELRAERG